MTSVAKHKATMNSMNGKRNDRNRWSSLKRSKQQTRRHDCGLTMDARRPHSSRTVHRWGRSPNIHSMLFTLQAEDECAICEVLRKSVRREISAKQASAVCHWLVFSQSGPPLPSWTPITVRKGHGSPGGKMSCQVEDMIPICRAHNVTGPYSAL